MHRTNKAFERYMQGKKNDSIKVYRKIREIKVGKIINLENKKARKK